MLISDADATRFASNHTQVQQPTIFRPLKPNYGRGYASIILRTYVVVLSRVDLSGRSEGLLDYCRRVDGWM